MSSKIDKKIIYHKIKKENLKMQIKQIKITDYLYDATLDLRTNLISIPFGFSPPLKEEETPDSLFLLRLKKKKLLDL